MINKNLNFDLSRRFSDITRNVACNIDDMSYMDLINKEYQENIIKMSWICPDIFEYVQKISQKMIKYDIQNSFMSGICTCKPDIFWIWKNSGCILDESNWIFFEHEKILNNVSKNE